MDLARYVVEAVVLEGRSYREVAQAHGVSKSWVAKLVSRYRDGGYEAIKPRSKAPASSPAKTAPEIEDRIVEMRKALADAGFDAGAVTIHYHLEKEPAHPPSVSTIWRVLRRRGFVTYQPKKRPRSSWFSFEASLPNECWQSDVTHWKLADGSDVEILNFLDDHSRIVIASQVFDVVTAVDVVAVFEAAGETWGFPSALLTDNGCIYTAWHRGGATMLETKLLALGIEYRHSSPYHPETCGKVERFHQTLKIFLAKQSPPASIAELQAQIESFVSYYNEIRPHRARDRMTPREAFDSRDKARPGEARISPGARTRVRQDRLDNKGTVTLRHNGAMHHIPTGVENARRRVIVLVDGLEIRVISKEGELLRELTLDPGRDYQPLGRPPGPPKGRKLGPRKKHSNTIDCPP